MLHSPATSSIVPHTLLSASDRGRTGPWSPSGATARPWQYGTWHTLHVRAPLISIANPCRVES
eukprot:3041547-Amphidinium_carterae.1